MNPLNSKTTVLSPFFPRRVGILLDTGKEAGDEASSSIGITQTEKCSGGVPGILRTG